MEEDRSSSQSVESDKEKSLGQKPSIRLNDESFKSLGQKPSIASRGIPSAESLYFPPHGSEDLRSFQDKDENPTRNLWNVEEVINFVFPRKYQKKYHETAVSFLRLLAEKLQLSGGETSAFISESGISKATFYNRVLPRLRRVGMIKIERDTVIALESKRKFRPMRISLSKTFGNYIMKIGDSWLAVVDDSRSRKKDAQQVKLSE